MQERGEDPGGKETQRVETPVPDELQGKGETQELEGRLETQGLKAEGGLGAANVKDNARSCSGERSPGGCRVVGTPRGCREERRCRRQQGRGETRQLESAPPPSIPFLCSQSSLQVIGDVLPLNQAAVLLERAAGWQQSQVDVSVSWVGKLEKCELDTHTFIYS